LTLPQLKPRIAPPTRHASALSGARNSSRLTADRRSRIQFPKGGTPQRLLPAADLCRILFQRFTRQGEQKAGASAQGKNGAEGCAGNRSLALYPHSYTDFHRKSSFLELDYTVSAIDIGISYRSVDNQAPKKEH
jgi:hypothetical protein